MLRRPADDDDDDDPDEWIELGGVPARVVAVDGDWL
jgi:hypothetical protein